MVANDWLVRPKQTCPKCGQHEVVWAKDGLWCLNCDHRFTNGSAPDVKDGSKKR
jgi:ribosomal protein L37AE/L43A